VLLAESFPKADPKHFTQAIGLSILCLYTGLIYVWMGRKAGWRLWKQSDRLLVHDGGHAMIVDGFFCDERVGQARASGTGPASRSRFACWRDACYILFLGISASALAAMLRSLLRQGLAKRLSRKRLFCLPTDARSALSRNRRTRLPGSSKRKDTTGHAAGKTRGPFFRGFYFRRRGEGALRPK